MIGNSAKAKMLCIALSTVLLTLSFPAAAQQSKIPRIGFLQGRVAPTLTNPDPLGDAFRKGLRELGYIDGKNILLEQRYGEGRNDRLQSLINELIQLKVDLLVIPPSQGIRAAKQATTTIPIVMITTTDPVATRRIDSLARPGGNITGITRLTRGLSGKRLELLVEAVPEVSRVGVITSTTTSGIEDYEAAARSLNKSRYNHLRYAGQTRISREHSSCGQRAGERAHYDSRCDDCKLPEAHCESCDKIPTPFNERG
jgi:putative ABC transport system substrate-binding protein